MRGLDVQRAHRAARLHVPLFLQSLNMPVIALHCNPVGTQLDRPSQERQLLLVPLVPTSQLNLQFLLLGHLVA